LAFSCALEHCLPSPHSEAPSAFAKTHSELLAKMNSAGYYTVYPPVSQLVFAFGAWLGSTITSATIWLKLPLFIGELCVLRLLFLMDKNSLHKGVSAYALLPLPIIEIVGNAHFEGLAVLGVLGAIYYLRKNGICVAIGMTLFLLPADLSSFGESLNLYFQKFEFNGSLYVFASALGLWYKGWNWIAVVGPSLSVLAMVSILALAFVRGWKNLDLATTLLFSFGVYILCATTVHPWYAIYLVALAPLTKFKWPYMLGFSVFLSYLAYGTEDVVVPLWASVLEYGSVLAVLFFEIQHSKPKST